MRSTIRVILWLSMLPLTLWGCIIFLCIGAKPAFFTGGVLVFRKLGWPKKWACIGAVICVRDLSYGPIAFEYAQCNIALGISYPLVNLVIR